MPWSEEEEEEEEKDEEEKEEEEVLVETVLENSKKEKSHFSAIGARAASGPRAAGPCAQHARRLKWQLQPCPPRSAAIPALCARFLKNPIVHLPI